MYEGPGSTVLLAVQCLLPGCTRSVCFSCSVTAHQGGSVLRALFRSFCFGSQQVHGWFIKCGLASTYMGQCFSCVSLIVEGQISDFILQR